MYCVLYQFNSTVQTPLHDSTPLHSTPLHSAFYPIPNILADFFLITILTKPDFQHNKEVINSPAID